MPRTRENRGQRYETRNGMDHETPSGQTAPAGGLSSCAGSSGRSWAAPRLYAPATYSGNNSGPKSNDYSHAHGHSYRHGITHTHRDGDPQAPPYAYANSFSHTRASAS